MRRWLMGLAASVGIVFAGCSGAGSVNPAGGATPATANTIPDNTALATATRAQTQAANGPQLPVVRDVYLRGTTAYALVPGALVVVDASKPAEPAIQATLTLTASTRRMAIDGLRAYVACAAGGLQIIDLSKPYDPQIIGTYAPNAGEVNCVAAANGLAVVGLGAGGVALVDVSEPTHPAELRVLPSVKRVHELVLQGSMIYALSDQVTVIDAHKPKDAQIVGGYESNDKLLTMAFHYDQTVLVGDKGLLLMSLAAPQNPVRLDAMLTETVAKAFGDTPGSATVARPTADTPIDEPVATPTTPVATPRSDTAAPAPPTATPPAAANTPASPVAGKGPVAPAAPVKPAKPPVMDMGVPRATVAEDRLLISRGQGGLWILGLDGGKTFTPLSRVANVTSAVCSAYAGGLLAIGTAEGQLAFFRVTGTEVVRLGALTVGKQMIETAPAPVAPAAQPGVAPGRPGVPGQPGQPGQPGTVLGQPGVPPMPGTQQGQAAMQAAPTPTPGAPAGAPLP